MTDTIRPALTPKEDAAVNEIRAWCPGHESRECMMDPSIFAFRDAVRASLGFTRDHVSLLREVSCCPTHNDELRALAAIIEALLPPEPK